MALNLSPMRTIAYAMPGAQLRDLCRELRQAGYEVASERGTREASIDGQRVMMALKHPSGVWIVRACPEVIQTEENTDAQ